MAGGLGRSRSDEGSEVPTIVISGWLEIGLNDESASENVSLAESREVFSTPVAIQVVHPPEQVR